ncbi:MAG TPA: hypothetical protein VKS60_16340 [Stellaceae bacterium]|nr:hypothetical protein [Stellaceae bacterium]
MLGSKAPWVSVERHGDDDKLFDEYLKESLAEWHERQGLTASET